MSRYNLGNFTKLGLGIGSLHIIPRGIAVQEERAHVALGGIGILLLFLGLLLLLGGI